MCNKNTWSIYNHCMKHTPFLTDNSMYKNTITNFTWKFFHFFAQKLTDWSTAVFVFDLLEEMTSVLQLTWPAWFQAFCDLKPIVFWQILTFFGKIDTKISWLLHLVRCYWKESYGSEENQIILLSQLFCNITWNYCRLAKKYTTSCFHEILLT